MWLALGNGRSADDLTQVLPDLAAIAQFTAELRRRLADMGVDGLEGMVALYRCLRGTLDGVPPGDLERVRDDVVALQRWLHEVAHRLESLGRLKRALGA